MSAYPSIRLSKLLEQDVLEPLVGHELLSLVQDCHDVVGVLVGHAVRSSSLEKYFDLFKIFAFFKKADGVVFTPTQ